MNRIKADAEREKSGLTSVELARKAKISESNLSAILNGRRLPYAPELKRLSRALNLPADELMKPVQE
jgi:transcriptional regulator with XRE-family HTH domain